MVHCVYTHKAPIGNLIALLNSIPYSVIRVELVTIKTLHIETSTVCNAYFLKLWFRVKIKLF